MPLSSGNFTKNLSNTMNWKQHIHSDTSVLLGKPVIKGTRISVELLLELYKNGWSNEMILESYPNLSNEILNLMANSLSLSKNL